MTPSPLLDPDYRDLLAAVRAAPDDDFPRLLLADRIEELGWPDAAAYVRWSVPAGPVRTARGVWDGSPFAGLPALPELPVGAGEGYVVQRGLVHVARCPTSHWLAHGPQIVRHPLACVRAVRLTDREPSLMPASGRRRVWSWWRVGRPRRPPRSPPPARFDEFPDEDEIPDEIWSRIAGQVSPYSRRKAFYSRDAAHAALSAAALAWAWSAVPAAVTPFPAAAS